MDYLFVCSNNSQLKKLNIPFTSRVYTSAKKYIESSAEINSNQFIAASDLWGINTHYWYHNDHVFICSNSITQIKAEIKNIEIDRESIYDILFLGFPYEGKSLYKNIRRLKANEKLNFDINEFKLSIRGENGLDNFYNSGEIEYDPDSLKKIFDDNYNGTEDISPFMTLSSGSDTRVILSILLHYDILPEAIVFGDGRSIELYYAQKLAAKYNIPITVLNSKISPDEYIFELKKYHSLGNHLVNGQGLHVARIFQNKLSSRRKIYLGFLGSQFIKGHFSEVMISPPFKKLLLGAEFDDVFNYHYNFLSETIKKEFAEYLRDSLLNNLLQESDPRLNIINYLYRNITSTQFGGLINCAQQQGYEVVIPFLSSDLILYAYKTGHNIIKNISMFEGFNWRKQFLFQSRMCKLMSDELYSSYLPQYGGSLKSVTVLPRQICRTRKFLYKQWAKYHLGRPFFEQIEREYLNNVKKKYLRQNLTRTILPEIIDPKFINGLDMVTLDGLMYLAISG